MNRYTYGMIYGTWVLAWGQFALWGLPAPDLLRIVARTVPDSAPDGGNLTVWTASRAQTVYAVRLRPTDALKWLTSPDSGGESEGVAFWRRVADHAQQLATAGQFTPLPDGGLIPEPNSRLTERLAAIMPPDCRAAAFSPALIPTPAALIEDFWAKLIPAHVTPHERPRFPRRGVPPYRALFHVRAEADQGVVVLGMVNPSGQHIGWPTRTAERAILIGALGVAARTCPAIAAALPTLALSAPAEIRLSAADAADFLAVTVPILRRTGHVVSQGKADA